MGRMSARFVAIKLGQSAQWVYEMWNAMGLVVKDKGNWLLTDLGRKVGGKYSSGSGVPTFNFEAIEKLMVDFYNKTKKK